MTHTHSNGDSIGEAAALQLRLNDPQTAVALNRLLDRIDALEATVASLSTSIGQAPQMVAMLADVADDTARAAAERGIDLDARLQAALNIAEKLTEPRTMAILTELLARLDQVEAALQLADQAPGMIAMGMDVTDEIVRNATANGLDIDKFTTQGLAALVKFSTLVASDEFDGLIQSGILDPATIDIISDVGETLAECKKDPPQRLGMFGLLRALNEPDAKVTMGFLANFARHFGHRICEERRRELGML